MTFSVQISGDAAAQLARVKEAAAANDVIFSGDTESGSFVGRGVAGKYTREGDNLILVTVDRKPFFATWGMVETKIREFFA